MILLPAHLNGYKRRKDRSVSVNFVSAYEVSSEDLQVIDELMKTESLGWLAFKENEITHEDMPEEDAESDDISPSQRLRKRMYVYHKEKKIEEPFGIWRTKQLEKIGQSYLDKLD